MKYQPYPVYKSTTEPEAPAVPSHWTAEKLKRVCRFAYGDSLPNENREDGPYDVFGSNGVVGSHSQANTLSPAIIIGRKGSFGKVTYSAHKAYSIDTTYYVDERLTSHNLRWLFYALSDLRLDSVTKDSAVPGLEREEAYQRILAVPRQDEERAIASHLDRETAKIEKLIAKKRELIRKLDEKRYALISHVVTRGLPPNAAGAAGPDPNVPLKPSGIGWLGDIPAQWQAGRLRRFATMKTGHTPSRQHDEYWEDCEIPWFTLADVWQLRSGTQPHLAETTEKISTLGLANSAAELLPAGTVVLSRTASVGFSGIMPVPMATSQDYWNWICGPNLLPDYLWYQFQAMRPEFEKLRRGSTHPTIYESDAAGLQVCVPPMAEQREIVAVLDHQTAKIGALSRKVQQAIERLVEYRSAVISAAVTGKIDVRATAEIT
jgi:type I restriction enzyme, S subunit